MFSLFQIDVDGSESFPSVKLVTTCDNAVPFGNAYFDTLCMIRNGGVKESKKKAVSEEFPENKIVIPTNVTMKNIKKYSFYDLLGLGDWGCTADNETMKKCYHKAVLLYHPDKKQMKSADPEEDRQVFLKVQEAYNTLTNETKRRAYDSQLDFDDSVPTEKQDTKALKKGIAGFIELYDPVFRRNARFAIRKPVPMIGDENTPISEVYAFYDYWVKFDSWRDFSTVGVEHKPDNAGSREERRWMVQENEKIAKKNKKKEIARVTDFVMRAMEIDPRVVADKEATKMAKEAVKLAREAESRKKEEELEAAKKYFEEEERLSLERAKSNKIEKDKMKKLQSKGRNILRKLLRAVGEKLNNPVSEDDIEALCTALDLCQLGEVNDGMGGESATKNPELLVTGGMELALKYLADSKKSIEQRQEEMRLEKEAKKAAIEQRSKNESTSKKKASEHFLTVNEMSMLSKAVAKFPAGSRGRWASVCAYLNDQLRPVVLYTEDECIRAAHNAVIQAPKK
mmetsp:Transcript_18216/g.18277  ORF Transcript_18216/g.18277 Transcript_18216/m.18277 type:complete len:511 (-) Transcript_18216:119-1651(-)